jgi:protocatechuate 3,4-dioxygenase beta subunit
MPGGYPDTDDPSHIHLHVDAPVHRHRYVTFWFEGDARLSDAKRRAIDAETVIVAPTRRPDGSRAFQHDLRLEGS